MSPLGLERNATRKDFEVAFPDLIREHEEQAANVAAQLKADKNAIVVIPINNEDRQTAEDIRMSFRNKVAGKLEAGQKLHTLLKTTKDNEREHLLFISGENLTKQRIRELLQRGNVG